jgi:hypothetical protein
MALFIFKINQQDYQLVDLPNGPLKNEFEILKETIARQLGSLRCEVHNVEPIVVLQSDGNQVMLGGVSGCCKTMTSNAASLISFPGMDSGKWTHAAARKELTFGDDAG